jgi:hypothetical protein
MQRAQNNPCRDYFVILIVNFTSQECYHSTCSFWEVSTAPLIDIYLFIHSLASIRDANTQHHTLQAITIQSEKHLHEGLYTRERNTAQDI